MLALKLAVSERVSSLSHHFLVPQVMDPQLKKLLEVSWEAWIDSGLDVWALRDSVRVQRLLLR